MHRVFEEEDSLAGVGLGGGGMGVVGGVCIGPSERVGCSLAVAVVERFCLLDMHQIFGEGFWRGVLERGSWRGVLERGSWRGVLGEGFLERGSWRGVLGEGSWKTVFIHLGWGW